MKKKKNTEKLSLWQERLQRNETAYKAELEKMDERENIVRGSHEIFSTVSGDKTKTALHVRNIAAELIESQVDSTIPMPKVTARRKEDEHLAKLIEDMLRDELDRLPFEVINDISSRTVPIQGGGCFLVEWDNTERTHFTVGELAVSPLHPKQVIPQDGITSGIEDMDYIILKIPQTKEYIRRRYGVDISDLSEEESELRGSGDKEAADDLVTQYIGYEKNVDGGISLYSWVEDTELCDFYDYQARRTKKCSICGTATSLDACPNCESSDFVYSHEEFEELSYPVMRSDGSQIGGDITYEIPTGQVDELGLPIVALVRRPTRIPYYKPNIFPVILQKNVSVYGKFLGDSDVDKIRDQQNTSNRLATKIINKLIKSGSVLTHPNDPKIRVDTEDMKPIPVDNAGELSKFGVYNLQGDINQDLVMYDHVYEEARQIIGITDSFQGRDDSTAISGKAKEFAAAQTAGRLESKRVMRDAAYAALFEAMFKFKLAYADEPRPVVSEDIHGNKNYRQFNRYDFLEKDAAGEWCWNDRFIFSVDASAPLASNREAMWQETRKNLESGAFGDPSTVETLILFWTKMEMLHYPGAAETKAYLMEQAERRETEKALQPASEQAGYGAGNEIPIDTAFPVKNIADGSI